MEVYKRIIFSIQSRKKDFRVNTNMSESTTATNSSESTTKKDIFGIKVSDDILSTFSELKFQETVRKEMF
jgi:hypothetical protein